MGDIGHDRRGRRSIAYVERRGLRVGRRRREPDPGQTATAAADEEADRTPTASSCSAVSTGSR